MSHYKARVHIRGAMDQLLYGDKAPNLRRRAIKLLTEHEPGWGSLQPDHVVMLEHVRQIDGNTAEWRPIETIYYHDLKDSELEWKRHAS